MTTPFLEVPRRPRYTPGMRWVVGPEDGGTVAEVLVRASADPAAVQEGRVFLGRRRVRREDEPVRSGDVLEVAAARAPTPGLVRVLEETEGVLAVDKPAGVPTIPDQSGAAHTLVGLVARHLGIDPGALHPTSRLDRDVSGVVLFARTQAARDRLARARAEGLYERRYVAIAARRPPLDRGTWDAPIGRAADPRLRAVRGRDAVPAATRYAVCGTAAPVASAGEAPAGGGPSASSRPCLLGLAPLTGRTHQIRLHAADAGCPLFGDRAYGGPARAPLASGRVVELRRIALHAARVAVPGGRGARLEVRSPVPDELARLWSDLGGDPSAWEGASSCPLD